MYKYQVQTTYSSSYTAQISPSEFSLAMIAFTSYTSHILTLERTSNDSNTKSFCKSSSVTVLLLLMYCLTAALLSESYSTSPALCLCNCDSFSCFLRLLSSCTINISHAEHTSLAFCSSIILCLAMACCSSCLASSAIRSAVLASSSWCRSA